MEFTVVKVEKPSNITRKLFIKVAAKEVDNRFQRGLSEVQKTAAIKGFRTGMVPITVVKQYYGADVRHQVFHHLIEDATREALRKEQIRAVGSPQIDTPDHKTGEGAHDHSIAEGQELSFVATVEVLPEIDVKGYTGLAATMEKTTVTEDDVEGVVKNMLDQSAQLEPVTGGLAMADGSMSSRPVKKGDFVDMNFSGGVVTPTGIEEKPGMKGSRMLEVGSDSLIPGFEENLIDMRRGETKTFKVPFPADFYEADLAGKDAQFTVTINEVKEKKLPTLDDEFVKTMGYESVKDFRDKARKHLEQDKAQQADRKLKSDLLAQIIEKNPFEVPAALIQAQTRALAQDVAQNLKQQGFTDAMIQDALKSELENLNKRAENQVRASLLLEAVAKKEKIAVTDAEVEAEMKKMAEGSNVELEKVKEFYEKNANRREDLEFRLREDRTLSFIIEKGKIKR